jgi:glycosyltransferase involved in cell wall biosynthesis
MNQSSPPAILHLIDTTGPGGAETIFTQLAHATQNLGYRTIAVIRGPGWVAAELERLGITTLIIDCKGSFNVSFLRKLMRLIRDEKIVLIQSHLLGSNVYASLAGLLTGTPVFSTFHGFVDVSPTERLRLIKFLLIQLGSKTVIAVTEQMREMLQSIPTVSRRKVITIANGVDTDVFKKDKGLPLREQYNLAEDSTLIGCLGNVRKAKNYSLAIETLQKLRKEGTNAVLLIAGDDKNALAKTHRNYAKELGVAESVIWLGFLQDTPGYLNGLDVFLLSSSSEGHPLALTQAMAVELPIVATRCGIEELVSHEDTVLLASVGDAAALAKEILRIISAPDLKRNLIKKARKLAEEHLSLNAMRKHYLELYQPYLSKSS